MTDLMLGLTECFTFYNTTRMYQSLGYNAPDVVYLTASGSGAKIIDKYNKTEKTSSEIETKNRGSAVPLHEQGTS
jgi:activator of 2-hydroxyglutaryl-CoA dehydratase